MNENVIELNELNFVEGRNLEYLARTERWAIERIKATGSISLYDFKSELGLTPVREDKFILFTEGGIIYEI